MSNLYNAAEWIWRHRGNDVWWRPSVLTNRNPDSESLGLSQVEAMAIFNRLVEERLLFPGIINTNERVFFINEINEKEWSRFIFCSKWYYRWFINPFLKLSRNIGLFIYWIISLIIASGIGAFISEWMHKIFEVQQ